MSNPFSMVAVVRLAVEPAWLALTRAERRVFAEQLAGIIARYPRVKVRWFDADVLGHGFTDFALCEFEELFAYHALWEELRDTAVFSFPYMRLVDASLGLERAYERYEAEHGA